MGYKLYRNYVGIKKLVSIILNWMIREDNWIKFDAKRSKKKKNVAIMEIDFSRGNFAIC